MTRLSAIGAAIAALCLAGCSASANEPPPAPSSADYNAFHERMLALTWSGFQFPSPLAAPPVTPRDPLEPTAWGESLHECMAAAGYPKFGYSWSNSEGYILLGIRHESIADQHQQTAFYFCVAQHALIPGENGMLVSADQLNYVYDYYARWTVPCLVGHGYQLRRVISREEFITVMGEWAPYWELPIYSGADHDRVIALCGPDRPAMAPHLDAQTAP